MVWKETKIIDDGQTGQRRHGQCSVVTRGRGHQSDRHGQYRNSAVIWISIEKSHFSTKSWTHLFPSTFPTSIFLSDPRGYKDKLKELLLRCCPQTSFILVGNILPCARRDWWCSTELNIDVNSSPHLEHRTCRSFSFYSNCGGLISYLGVDTQYIHEF